jgi:mannose-6-phosphate isomerase-like protein (cupin superfamily)
MAQRILHVRESEPICAPMQLGPYQIEALIPEADEAAGTAYRVTIAPHSTTAVSYHLVAEEVYYVISGRGTAMLDGAPFLLQTGDFLRLPPGTTHGFITTDVPLVMLDLHSPGSRPNRDVFFIGEKPKGFG